MAGRNGLDPDQSDASIVKKSPDRNKRFFRAGLMIFCNVHQGLADNTRALADASCGAVAAGLNGCVGLFERQ
jgi:hypothetical protein